MYRHGDTIKNTLEEIHRHNLVLPAIQREFVWKSEQICRLFDSIMQGFPIGTFLYWRVASENSGKFKFFDFVRDYHQRDSPHCAPLSTILDRQVTAVLDGQQRLTALNIGLHGSVSRKLRYKWWNNPDAFPKTRLYLDLLWRPDENEEEGLRYRFRFLTKGHANPVNKDACWFPVKQVLDYDKVGSAMTRWLNQRLPQEQVDDAFDILARLHQVVHSEGLVSYYEETSQELDKALQIFLRMNDGGTPLSHSDLLLSIAVAQWNNHDAREEIHDLVDELNRIGIGFTFSKDLVLKAGLMLSEIGSVGFKVDNFNRENMNTLEERWEEIKSALILTVRLVSSFGFNGRNLTSQNSILPIAYYLYKRSPGDVYLTKGNFERDRQSVREWLIRSLLKSGVWGSGLDTLLTDLRETIRDAGHDIFPDERLREAMARRGKALYFSDEEIEELADMEYGNRLTFSLLSLLFPFVDLRNHFHMDHIFPSSRFTERRLRKAGVDENVIEDFRDMQNRLANLQLLQGSENNEKRAKMPRKWLESESSDYANMHLLGNVPDSITDFGSFYEARRERLKQRITDLLGR